MRFFGKVGGVYVPLGRWIRPGSRKSREPKPTLKRPRWLQWLKALACGYFWMPCPICGRMFGGHEEHGSWDTWPGGGLVTCIECKNEAKRRTLEMYAEHGIKVSTKET